MPRQLNFPLHSRSENIVNHSHDLNKVLNYTKQVFFIRLSLRWIVQTELGYHSVPPETLFSLLLLFCCYSSHTHSDGESVGSPSKLDIYSFPDSALLFLESLESSYGKNTCYTTALWKHYRLCRGKGEQLSLKIPEAPTSVSLCRPKTSIADYFFFWSPFFTFSHFSVLVVSTVSARVLKI